MSSNLIASNDHAKKIIQDAHNGFETVRPDLLVSAIKLALRADAESARSAAKIERNVVENALGLLSAYVADGGAEADRVLDVLLSSLSSEFCAMLVFTNFGDPAVAQ
ncbi:MAG: hypothetical protein CML67_06420 [Rhodobacteraceae bacterium]|nr:hypothetical protein [Paracoccaceae bacterium]